MHDPPDASSRYIRLVKSWDHDGKNKVRVGVFSILELG